MGTDTMLLLVYKYQDQDLLLTKAQLHTIYLHIPQITTPRSQHHAGEVVGWAL